MGDESYESALVTEFQALAGVPSGSTTFAIRCGAGTVTVVYKQWSSSPSDLTLEARYDEVARVLPGYRNRPAPPPVVAARPLDLQLRHEDREDRAAKTQGLNVEWQAGDPAFDDAVYVSTPGHGAEVLAAVLNAEVRGAIMSLFALGFRLVAIDDAGAVRAHVTEFVVARPQQGRGRDAMDAFVRLLTSLPVVTASGASHAPVPLAATTRAFGWTAFLFSLLFIALIAGPAFLSQSPSPTTNPLGFVTLVVGPWIALAVAFPVFHLARRLHGDRVASRMRGSSRAAVTAQRAGWAAGLCALSLVACAIHAIALAVFVLPR